MEKLFLTYGKALSIYSHRNNCGENVCGKIVGCQRKNQTNAQPKLNFEIELLMLCRYCEGEVSGLAALN